MDKKEIHDEMLRIKRELILNKRDETKCAELNEEYKKIKKELAGIMINELQKQEAVEEKPKQI